MRILLSVLLLLLSCTISFAQTDEPIFEEFQFNFATPGARATSMGRAFIGLADDATAAQTNPAGLTILSKPEVSFEYKHTSYVIERSVDASPDLVEFGESVDNPAFVSVVYPAGPWRFAFYRHEFINYEEVFSLETRQVPGGFLFNGEDTTIDFLGENYGAALAYRLNSKVFLGASLRFSRLDISTNREFIDVVPGIDAGQFTIEEADSKIGFALGTILNPNRSFSIGVVYERNPEFEFTESFLRNGSVSSQEIVHVGTPDRFGVGIAYRPHSSLVFVADIVHVTYSELTDDFTIVAFNTLSPEDFEVEDATEFHAGVEKVFLVESNVISIRGGFFTNPEHDLRYIGPSGSPQRISADVSFNTERDYNQVGITFGGGIAIGGRFQLDAAYLISDPFDEFSTSFVFRF